MSLRDQLQSLLRQFEDARLSARDANLQRYDDILQGYQQYEGMMDARTNELLDFLGVRHDQQRQQMGDMQQRRLEQAPQDAWRRGLTAASLQSSAVRGAEQTSGLENRILNDQIQRDQIGYESALTSQALQARLPGLEFQERRQDVGPQLYDVGQVAELHGTARGGGEARRYNVF
jgi:LAS superfamily LD-carboxypeptidase LdcB